MTAKWLLPLLAAVATALASLLVWAQLGRPAHGIDDAQIFLTYGQNLADGEGFVYNPGGERVEGFTSPLWVLVCAAAIRICGAPEQCLQLLSILLAAIAVAATARFAAESVAPTVDSPRGGMTATWAALLVTIWCVTSPGFIAWTTATLMDTGLWCLVLTLGTLAFARASVREASRRQSVVLSLAVVAAIVTRPESMLIGLVWLLSLALALVTGGREFRAASRAIALPTLAYVAAILLLLTFRMTYFGFPFPNTYYAKVSPDRLYNIGVGVKYLAHFAIAQPLAALIAVLAAWVCVRAGWQLFGRARRSALAELPVSNSSGPLVVVSSVVLAALTVPVLAGGDHFALYRFYQPVWPLLALVPILFCFGTGCGASWPRAWTPAALGTGRLRMLGAAMLMALAASQWRSWSELRRSDGLQAEFGIADNNLLLGKALNHTFAENRLPSIGVVSAGSVARTYNGPVIDLMGLNSVAMGHSAGDRKGMKNHAAFDPGVFYSLAPDIVAPTIGSADGVRALFKKQSRPWLLEVFHGMLNDTRFRESYVPFVIELDQPADPNHAAAGGYLRRSLLEQLARSGVRITVIEWPTTGDN